MTNTKASILLSLLYFFLSVHTNASVDVETEMLKEGEIYRAYFPSEKIAVGAAISFHANLLEARYDEGFLVMQLTDDDKTKLTEHGFKFDEALAWKAQYLQRYGEMQNILSLREQQASSDGLAFFETENLPDDFSTLGIPGYQCYETLEETFAAAQGFTNSYPNLAEWIDVGDSWQKTAGLGGHDMNVLILTNKNTSGEKPILFINSAIHAREYTTAPLTLAFAEHLLQGYGTDADATWILDHHEVHMMLHTNPDGRKRAEAGSLWRKNTNQNYCGPNSSSRGADLNRNFTFDWNVANGSSGNECAETYRGPTAGSEPETQAVEAYVRSIYADRRGPGKNDAAPLDTSGIHLDIHSYSELVLWPWGDTSRPAPNATELQTLGRKFAWFNGYYPEQSVGLYPTDGTSDGVSYGELGVAAYTFELGTSFFQSCSAYENTVKPDNLPALIYAAKVVRTPYITPAGPDVYQLALSTDVVIPGESVTLTATATDTRFSSRNGNEQTQNIGAAEFYIDLAPWEAGAQAIAIGAADGAFNAKTESLSVDITATGLSEGKHILYVRARDAANNWGPISAIFLTVSGDVIPTPTPTVTPPPTEDYCDASGVDASYEWISSVDVGEFSHSSGSSGYSDFTSQEIPLLVGNTAVALTPAFRSSTYRESWKIWIDLNQDGDFSDSGEEVFSSNGLSSSVVSGELTVPASALEGATRMRVIMRYNTAPAACGNFNYGEVEDYTVIIGGDGGGGGDAPSEFSNEQSQAIPDQSTITSVIAVPQNAAKGESITVSVDVTHTYHGDLRMTLMKDGNIFTVKQSGNDNTSGSRTYSLDINTSDVDSLIGEWQLTIADVYSRDTGTLDMWKLVIN
ncbi:Carboxypeptidase T [Thalassocella blandensis]|nr:Carboxypeptidase T [Thalassocella blandensis]